ncbi:MAG TPA: Lrp/AsnC family transcriptional regulator [Candidatus Lokiarchaeia archaeon]|nr:Lrp/AsnC family transcriptional regulator [Candidatus Lokiarchaeia archaeon]
MAKKKEKAIDLDEKDRAILKALQENCKVPYKEMGRTLGFVASTIHARVKKMEEQGVIKQFIALVDPTKLNYNVNAILGLSVDPTKIREVGMKISEFPEVKLVANSTGDHDLLVHILVPDNSKLGELILKIKSIDGVLQGAGNIHISIFTRVFKDSHYVEPFTSSMTPKEE